MLLTGWEVRIGRNCAQGLEYGLRRYSDWGHSFSQYRPTKTGEQHFYFFPTEILKFHGNFTSASNLCVLKKGAFVLMLFKARDRLQTKTKHYNMIFNLSFILFQLSSLSNKERLSCLGRQFIIWVSNKDKRIDELKSHRKENTAKIIESSRIIIKTA